MKPNKFDWFYKVVKCSMRVKWHLISDASIEKKLPKSEEVMWVNVRIFMYYLNYIMQLK